jgi:hypothetical protein
MKIYLLGCFINFLMYPLIVEDVVKRTEGEGSKYRVFALYGAMATYVLPSWITLAREIAGLIYLRFIK